VALQQEHPKSKVEMECEAVLPESEATRPITRRVALQQEHPKSKVGIECEAVCLKAKPRGRSRAEWRCRKAFVKSGEKTPSSGLP
jgi:hypothetical protein